MATTLLALAGLVAGVASVSAQSITNGTLAGIVVGIDGQPMAGVQVQLRPIAGGRALLTESRGMGTFLFALVQPGEYELLAERLGYRPVLVTPLPVRPDRRLDVRVTLEPAEGAGSRNTATFKGSALAGGSRPGRSRSYGELELRTAPTRDATLGELLAFSSRADAGAAVEGLPLDLGVLAVEGLAFRAAGDVGVGSADAALRTLLVPNRSSGGAELLVGRPDVEWPSSAGGLLSTALPGAATGTTGEVGGVWGGEALSLDEAPAGFTSWRVGASGGRSLAADSAHVWGFAEAQHDEVPVELWSGRAGSPEAFGTAGVDISSLLEEGAGATDRVNAGGRFGWTFAGGRSLQVVALYGQAERDHARASLTGADLPAAIDARDFFAGATATAELTGQVAVELRAGFGQSTREYTSRGLVDTGVGDAAVALIPAGAQLGGDPAWPATLERSAFTGQATVHLRNADHHVKLGGGVQLASHDRSGAWGRDGVYLFGSAADLAARTGVFQGLEGPEVAASFSVLELFAYGQDSWRVAPGFDLTTGIRYETEILPSDDVVPNRRWRELTGVDNAALPGSVSDVALVAGFSWDVQEQHVWRVRGAVTMEAGDVAPGLLAEALTYDGRLEAVAAVGDVADPTPVGPRLTVLSPGLEAPLTTRASVGISRALGSTGAFHLDGAIRQTINLPVRTDLNLAPRPAFRDAYGRPVFGRLVAAGPLVYPEPGSNRRFSEFEAVAAIASSATSTWRGVTATLEKRYGFVRGVTSYTYSRTEDDWPGGGASLDGLPPFAAEEGLEDWTDGTSDFDVPHRFTLAAELTLPFAPMVTAGGFWRIQSGRPFTPGFGRAIDANGDGIAGNDPAFIDDAIEGVAELQQAWECLRTGAGQFAERNSCRAGARTLLDAWVGVQVPALSTVKSELRIEALGLDAEGADGYDTALFLLDPEGSVTSDPQAGQVNVPLRANPRFGQALTPPRELARLRISLRVVF